MFHRIQGTGATSSVSVNKAGHRVKEDLVEELPILQPSKIKQISSESSNLVAYRMKEDL